ncbi:hypothetical protein [Burkholderia ubonensis]|uniref:hypothetical protein n=1 Tax=Burkholderia ubonensis TaxID=101571 RepID=UPI001E492EF5|nr:hypothetical protein [Burkholderia ubonensis]
MPPMQRHVAVILPTRETAFVKPFAPPPSPQQNPKLLYSRFIRSRFIQDLHVSIRLQWRVLGSHMAALA